MTVDAQQDAVRAASVRFVDDAPYLGPILYTVGFAFKAMMTENDAGILCAVYQLFQPDQLFRWNPVLVFFAPHIIFHGIVGKAAVGIAQVVGIAEDEPVTLDIQKIMSTGQSEQPQRLRVRRFVGIVVAHGVQTDDVKAVVGFQQLRHSVGTMGEIARMHDHMTVLLFRASL